MIFPLELSYFSLTMKGIRIYIVLILLAYNVPAPAQTQLIEALQEEVYDARNDEEKLGALLALCEEYQSIYRDSLDVYAPLIKELAEKSKNQRYKSLAELAYANWYYRWGWSDSSLVFIEPEISKNPVTNSATRDIYFKISRAKAIYLGSKSRYAEALDVLYKILPEAEKYRDTVAIGMTCNTIGSVSVARQEADKAKFWVQRAITIAGAGERFIEVLAPAYLNMAYAYALLGKSDSAEYFIEKGLPLCRKMQNLYYMATALRIQANIYTGTKRYKEAENALLEMIETRRKIAPASFFVEDNLQLAEFYANSGQIEKAIEVCKDNLRKGDRNTAGSGGMITVNNDPITRLEYLDALGRYYKMAGKTAEYQATLEELVVAKDSLYKANSAEAIAELQTKYEVQKKENTILQQKYDLQRKNFLFYGSVALTLIMAGMGFALFRNYKKKQRAKMGQMMAEEKKQAELAIKQAEEKERVRIAADLHDNLGAYAASMASNLSYINISNADEKSENAFKELSNNSNAIISRLNDTIWVLKKEELSITAISDRIKAFISRIQKSYPGVETEVEEHIEVDHKLPSSQAFHLYQILQEAVSNAFRHSKGKNIRVKITAAETWCIRIIDDGVGMIMPEAEKNNGNGLLHMKERSQEAGWSISWGKPPEGGTIVEIASTTN